MGQLLNKHNLLVILEKQSLDWITNKNTDVNVNKNLEKVIPPTIISHQDYYRRLQKRALLIETGNLDEAEATSKKTKIHEYKNNVLQDIYKQLKENIRHVTYTPEHAIYSIYLDYETRLKNNLVLLRFYKFQDMKTEEMSVLKIRLTEAFKRLIAYQRLEYEKPITKFKMIESQLQSLFQLIISWTQYVNFLYKTDAEMEILVNTNYDGLYNERDPNIGLFTEEEKNEIKEKFGDEAIEYLEKYKQPFKGHNPEDYIYKDLEEDEEEDQFNISNNKNLQNELDEDLTDNEKEEVVENSRLKEKTQVRKLEKKEFGTNRRSERLRLLNELYGGFGEGK